MLSISTCLNYKTDIDISRWVLEIKDAGFDAIELDYKISRTHLEELKLILKDTGIKVSSVHNFCPSPNDGIAVRHLSNFYRLSAVDNDEREKAVLWTHKTIETAVEFGAKYVVVHAGTIESEDDRSSRLFELIKEGKKDTEEFVNERIKILKQRELNKAPYIDSLIKSLDEIVSFGQDHHVKIGLETRYYPTEIPNFDEIRMFLGMFYDKGLCYWHDVGHAQINDILGITEQLDFVDNFKDQMQGMHIHGVTGIKDHLVPFEGDMDLNLILSRCNPDVLKVVETRAATADQLKSVVSKLKEHKVSL